jgi:hypothetical protein
MREKAIRHELEIGFCMRNFFSSLQTGVRENVLRTQYMHIFVIWHAGGTSMGKRASQCDERNVAIKCRGFVPVRANGIVEVRWFG